MNKVLSLLIFSLLLELDFEGYIPLIINMKKKKIEAFTFQA